MSHSAALFRAANLRIMDYPFDAALASALRVCDEAVVVVAQSEDDTHAWVQALARRYPGRVTVRETIFVYDRMWQQRWWELAASLTDAEWLMYHDADESIHPRHADTLRQLMAQDEVMLIRFPYIHLYATAGYYMAHGFYSHNTRLGRRSAGYAMVNWCTDQTPKHAACAMVANENGRQVDAHQPNRQGLVNVQTPMLHYGWCRTPQALAISQTKHRAWYSDGAGLEDGHVPDVPSHHFRLGEMIANGRVARYAGDHPADLDRWLDAHRDGWAQLETELAETVTQEIPAHE